MRRALLLEVIVFVIILLFFYSAVSKLADHQNFVVQLTRSPLLSGLSVPVGWIVPIIEIIVVVMLMVTRFRMMGMYGALLLMVTFTVYIGAMLTFSKELPCACGGVISFLGWKSHLLFNFCFIALCIAGVVLLNGRKNEEEAIVSRKTLRPVIYTFVSGVLVVGALYWNASLYKEEAGEFIRYFNGSLIEISTSPLEKDTYYIAGLSEDQIFLGDAKDPYTLVVFDSSLNRLEDVKIKVQIKRSVDFEKSIISVDSSVFFVMNGQLPAIIKGSVNNWIASDNITGIPFFKQALAISNNAFAISAVLSQAGSTINQDMIGMLTPTGMRWNPDAINGEQGNVYSATGFLRFSEACNKVIYVYTYQNRYVVMDTSLNVLNIFSTIDSSRSTKVEQIEVGQGIYEVKAISGFPNRNAQVVNNLLFIQSDAIGRNEDADRFEQSSVIDVYDLELGVYRFSFYIPNRVGKRMRSFIAGSDHLLSIYDGDLVKYSMKSLLRNSIANRGRPKT